MSNKQEILYYIYIASPKVNQGKQVDLRNRKPVDQNLACYLRFNLI